MRYVVAVTFSTDRELTPDELSELGAACAAQVEDPHTWEDGQSVPVSYGVRGGSVAVGVARRGVRRVLAWGEVLP